jgi:glycine amidinotransferase
MIYTEWDPLKEIIVGKVYDPADIEHIEDIEFRNGLQRILAESEEDFIKLTELFESYGVVVHRPKCNFRKELGFHYPAVCPRDMHFVYGDKIINTIGGDPNRYFESDYFTDIMLGLDRDYYAMPRPTLPNYYAPYQFNEGKILYHAANILKCGDAVIYTQPYNTDLSYTPTRQFGRGTDLGLEWMKKNVDARWIGLHESGHADGKIALIKPGLLMCWLEDMIPPELQSWDRIVVPKQNIPEQFWQSKRQPIMRNNVEKWLGSWIGHVDETIFDVNVVSVSPELVITNGYDAGVAAQLKRHGVEMVPFNFRHKFFWDGGLHCVTLDLTREGKKETYV